MSQMTKLRMRIVCWVPKGTNTHSEYVTFISLPLQQWLHERAPCYVIRTLPVLFLLKVTAIKTNRIIRVGDVLTAVLFKIKVLLDIISCRLIDSPIFRGKESNRFGFFTPEDGTERMSRNVGKKLRLLAA